MQILFVCVGNTCRSPMAEAIMQQLIHKNQLDWYTDSAALREWNVGREPEARCIKILTQHGLKTKHLGRMITPEDFLRFDYILGMDEFNLQELRQLATNYETKPNLHIGLLGTYLQRKEDEIIPDPYFTSGMSGFCSAFAQINESCINFVRTKTTTQK